MSAIVQDDRLALWIRWVVLSAVGVAGGLAAGLALGAPIESIVGMMLVTPTVMAIAGSILGASQWLWLRRRLRRSGWWILASALGLGIGLTAGVVVVEFIGRALAGEPVRFVSLSPAWRAAGVAVIGTLAGFTLGGMQWFVLRREVSGAGHWVLFSSLGLGIGLAGGVIAADLLFGGVGTPLGFGVFLALGGLVVGAVTGRSVIRLQMQPSASS